MARVDKAYQQLNNGFQELEHKYGDNVHILADPFLLTHLGFLCQEGTTQPAVNNVVRDLYRYLIKAVMNGEFPRVVREIKTRMAAIDPNGVWTGQCIDPDTKAVTVNIARAGTLPSQECFDFLNKTMNPEGVRQDHVIMARVTDDDGKVTGSHFGDSKIGGDVDDRYVLFPDPMGATGSSLSQAISYYKDNVDGAAKKFICVNLIVTPEYVKRLKDDHPEVVIYAVRLDRGASPADVLETMPGERWDEESGLTDKQYIVPGGGGFGEIMNNAYC
jgi:uracil phosphoribosyltransferase